MTLRLQPVQVPIGKFDGMSSKVPVYVTEEWRRALEDLFKVVNAQQVLIASMQARLTAGGL